MASCRSLQGTVVNTCARRCSRGAGAARRVRQGSPAHAPRRADWRIPKQSALPQASHPIAPAAACRASPAAARSRSAHGGSPESRSRARATPAAAVDAVAALVGLAPTVVVLPMAACRKHSSSARGSWGTLVATQTLASPLHSHTLPFLHKPNSRDLGHCQTPGCRSTGLVAVLGPVATTAEVSAGDVALVAAEAALQMVACRIRSNSALDGRTPRPRPTGSPVRQLH